MRKYGKYLATVEFLHHSVELPVDAESLEEATELAEAEYEQIGRVTRVRPVVEQGGVIGFTTH